MADGDSKFPDSRTHISFQTPLSEPIEKETAQVTGTSISLVSEKLRDLTDATLNFLSTASNETLGACVVGLAASTYLVLGRFGLVLIGAVGGVVLHATWEASNHAETDEQTSRAGNTRRRRALGVDVVRRTLDWMDSKRKAVEESEEASEVEAPMTEKPLDYEGFRPATRTALNNLTDAVIRDYIKWWYTPLLPTEENFPNGCRQTLTSFIISISNHLSRKRPADPFLDFLANSASIVIVFLDELSNALQASQRQPPTEAVQTYIKCQPESNLANVLSITHQERKLDLVADDILQNFLDSKTYNFPLSRTFLRKMLSGVVLEMTIRTCSKPEWINGWIVYLLEDGEPEIMNMIDEGVQKTVDQANASDAKNMEERKGHKRRVSRAEEAMEQAMLEAKRINEMIAEEEASKRSGSGALENDDAFSTATTEEGMATPTSSDSDLTRSAERSAPIENDLGQTEIASPTGAMNPSKSVPTAGLSGIALSNTSATLSTAYTSPTAMEAPVVSMLTLHNAALTIFDDGDPNDRSIFRQKPNTEYLLQIEPALSQFRGWVIARKYVDFETLHETLRRIAIVSGLPEFAQKYPTFPGWKGQTRGHVRQDLEQYVRLALQYEQLAESEAMKKFLEKETGQAKTPTSKSVLGFQNPAALEAVGKGFINVLGQAPKGIAGGGKAVLGGVQGVFGAVATGVAGPKKSGAISSRSSKSAAIPGLSRNSSYNPTPNYDHLGRNSSVESTKPPPLLSRPARPGTDSPRSRSSSRHRAEASQESLNLPPPPSDIPDDYDQPRQSPIQPSSLPRTSTSTVPDTPLHSTSASASASTPILTPQPSNSPSQPPTLPKPASQPSAPTYQPLTESETRITIDLLFALLTSLYSLSSAWSIRLSLLAAARSFLLRPASPQLESIRTLLQDSLIDANTSDLGIAAHINKVRKNALPTAEELEKWPKELSQVEKTELRMKARRLLVERGMPQALTSVMGQAASGEALGRVFDCLQVEEVSRGLVFGLMLQGVRAVTQ